MILRADSEKFEYLSRDETKNENILSHCSVAQAGSNDEKIWGRKSRWTVPLSMPESNGLQYTVSSTVTRIKGAVSRNLSVLFSKLIQPTWASDKQTKDVLLKDSFLWRY